MAENGLNTRDLKLVQWLNEAYAKEAELEADLTAHIALTQKDSYKKRLRKHLTETRDHKKRVAARIKKLGGTATAGPHIPGVPGAVGEVAGKTVAAVKGQVGTARAAVTGQAETHLRNAQEELREEHVEIALYNRIETFASQVGDKETAQLAKSIRRDEERMAKFLDSEMTRLVKEIVRAEVPREERATTGRSRSGRSSSRSSGSSRSRSSSRSGSSASSSSSRSSRSSGSSRSGGSSGSSRGSRSSGSSSRSTRSSGSSGGSSSSRGGGSRSTSSRSSGSRSSSSGSSGSRSSSSGSSGSRSSSSRSSSARSASSRNGSSGSSRSGSTRSGGGSRSGGSSSRSRASSRS